MANNDLTYRDVALYQAFVMGHGAQKDAAFLENEERIRLLRRVQEGAWRNKLHPKLCRSEIARRLMERPPRPPATARAALFIDEAQDYLQCEIQLFISIREAWEREGLPTTLLLLGDLNQRIQPTGFFWQDLVNGEGRRLGTPRQLLRNYRNCAEILRVAQRFHELGRHRSGTFKGRALPPPALPEHAEAGGEVRLLVYPDAPSAFEFLRLLNDLGRTAAEERYLVHKLARQAKVVWPRPNWPTGEPPLQDLLVYDTSGAKGKEFESCIVFHLFEGDGFPSIEETFRWYTVLTRARERLLIVATQSELHRLQPYLLEGCTHITDPDLAEARAAAVWATEQAGDVELREIADGVDQRLLCACDRPWLYWDTYRVFHDCGLIPDEWERRALDRLRRHSREQLWSEFQRTPKDLHSLRCLLLRALYEYRQAQSEAMQCCATNAEEYKRLLTAIATDLEEGINIGSVRVLRPYEAARVRRHLGQALAETLPLREVAEQSGCLAARMCEHVAAELKNLLEERRCLR